MDDALEISHLSLHSLKLDLYFNEKKLGIATGFFFFKNKSYYLISNWHVFSGKNSETGELLDDSRGSVPNKVKVEIIVQKPNGIIKVHPFEFHLRNSNGIPIFFEHPKHGRKYCSSQS